MLEVLLTILILLLICVVIGYGIRMLIVDPQLQQTLLLVVGIVFVVLVILLVVGYVPRISLGRVR